jgi:hypothetical protein
MRRSKVLLFCCTLLSSVLSGVPLSGPAHALPDVDAAACTAGGPATHSLITLIPAPATYAATLTLACVVAGNGDDGGAWTLNVTAAGPLESCAEGEGAGTITGGTSAFDGAVIGGGFTYVRIGNVIQAVGTIFTALDGATGHPFSAELVYLPTVPGCPDSGVGTVTGTLELADGQAIPLPDVDGVPCAVAANIAYAPPGVALGPPVPLAFNAVFAANCLGVGDDAGIWGFTVAGFASTSCPAETVVLAPIGAGPAAGDGAVAGGTVSWVRTGVNMHVAATILTTNGETHHLVADMLWNALPGPVCGVPNAWGANATGPGALVDI